jgi:hypothetical protein
VSAIDDLRALRDALDLIVHGGVPSWLPPTTQAGEQAQAAAISLYSRWVAALHHDGRAKVVLAEKDRLDDEHRAHAAALTERLERAERERDAARRDRDEREGDLPEIVDAWRAKVAELERDAAVEVERLRAAQWSAEQCAAALREGGHGACAERLRGLGADARAALSKAQEQGAAWALAAARRAAYDRVPVSGQPGWSWASDVAEAVAALDENDVCREARET